MYIFVKGEIIGGAVAHSAPYLRNPWYYLSFGLLTAAYLAVNVIVSFHTPWSNRSGWFLFLNMRHS